MADDLKVLVSEVEEYERHVKIVEDGISCIITQLKDGEYSRERDSNLISHIVVLTRDER